MALHYSNKIFNSSPKSKYKRQTFFLQDEYIYNTFCIYTTFNQSILNRLIICVIACTYRSVIDTFPCFPFSCRNNLTLYISILSMNIHIGMKDHETLYK